MSQKNNKNPISVVYPSVLFIFGSLGDIAFLDRDRGGEKAMDGVTSVVASSFRACIDAGKSEINNRIEVESAFADTEQRPEIENLKELMTDTFVSAEITLDAAIKDLREDIQVELDKVTAALRESESYQVALDAVKEILERARSCAERIMTKKVDGRGLEAAMQRFAKLMDVLPILLTIRPSKSVH